MPKHHIVLAFEAYPGKPEGEPSWRVFRQPEPPHGESVGGKELSEIAPEFARLDITQGYEAADRFAAAFGITLGQGDVVRWPDGSVEFDVDIVWPAEYDQP